MARLCSLSLLLFLSTTSRAQSCESLSTALALSASATGPALTLPEGPPVPGSPFAVKVEEAAPASFGLFAFSLSPSAVFLTEYEATLYLSFPLSGPESFLTNATGASPSLFAIPSVPADLCGFEIVMQAVVLDAAALGGLAFSNALQVTVGEPQGSIVFTSVNAEANLTNMYTTGNTHAGGTAWIDYNNDYWPDLFVSNGGGWAHYLYRNEGDGTFTDVSHLVPKPDLSLEDGGAKFGDIDNDGDLDLLVFVDSPTSVTAHEISCTTDPCNPTEGGPNLLYVNQGDGTFLERGASHNIVDALGRRNNAAGFADYDRDGFIDLYLGNWALYTPGGHQHNNWDGLLHNDGDGTYSNVTTEMGLLNPRDSLTCLWFDLELDGWPDLYIGNASNHVDDALDSFYLNQGGTALLDASASMPHIGDDAIAAMGMDVGDIDNDGDWDLYITDNRVQPDPLGNPLYLGQPDGTLSENVAPAAGVGATNSWPCNFVDFDLDGWIDLWVGTIGPGTRDYLYLNNQDGTFADVPVEAFKQNDAKGGSAADYDGDGDIDLVLWNQSMDSEVLRNDSPTGGPGGASWIEFKLLGRTSNHAAIGATVYVTGGGQTQMRRVTGGDSAHSQSDLILHFGVNSLRAVDVRVDWPSGTSQSYTAVAAHRLVIIDELDGLLSEELLMGSATYDPLLQTLSVAAWTNFRGRTELAVPAFGALAYDASALRFAADFAAPAPPPTSVTLTSASGSSWVVPVTE